MKRMKPSKLSLLPLDVVVKIVFFVREWNDVLALLEALRPSNVLGPLESLWRLHLLTWRECDLWPTLDLTKLDETSRTDVEKIAKFYSTVTVDVTMNLDWFCQYIHPNASVELMDGRHDDLDKETLAKWKDIRVVAINEKILTMPSYLVYFPRLAVISSKECTREMAGAIFDYVASSTTLRSLEVEACFTDGFCPITSTMANKLHQWIQSQPIESVTIKYFVWELRSQRHAVVSTALAKSSLRKLEIDEENISGWFFSWCYCRAKMDLRLEFRGPRNVDFERLDTLIKPIYPFDPF
ncbi:hypothetical protein AeRB84_008329 [Aphanomyces euteiches]|nr:hypothetical protein AeRB84_008329 [Aphanomyces euteiches]